MARIRPWRRLALGAVVLMVLAATANAQTGAASITGLVLDETGGALPGVTITATNQATNVTYVGVTNDAGNYTITSVLVGTYVVKAELAGFRTAATAAVRLEARQVARFDFKMAVGQIQETVVVEGTSPLLQTETVTVGEVISGTHFIKEKALTSSFRSPSPGRPNGSIKKLSPSSMPAMTGLPSGRSETVYLWTHLKR